MFPTDICISSWMDSHRGLVTQSIAFLHIFGSNQTGPYYHQFISGPGDWYVDTTVRIKEAYRNYIDSLGKPDLVILQTEQWVIVIQLFFSLTRALRYATYLPEQDTQYVVDFFGYPTIGDYLWNNSISNFRRNMNLRLDEIVAMVGPAVDVGLRTAVWVPSDGEITREFNEIVRSIAEQRNMTFYDMDKDVWSTVNFESIRSDFLLRDWMHPKFYYTGANV